MSTTTTTTTTTRDRGDRYGPIEWAQQACMTACRLVATMQWHNSPTSQEFTWCHSPVAGSPASLSTARAQCSRHVTPSSPGADFEEWPWCRAENASSSVVVVVVVVVVERRRISCSSDLASAAQFNQHIILIETTHQQLSLIHIWRCRRSYACRSRWSPYH